MGERDVQPPRHVLVATVEKLISGAIVRKAATRASGKPAPRGGPVAHDGDALAERRVRVAKEAPPAKDCSVALRTV